MFATKSDAVAWVNDFAKDANIEAKRIGKYWGIYDADGFCLSDEQIAEIESVAKPEVRE